MTDEAANNPTEGAAAPATEATTLLSPQPFDGWKDSDKQAFIKEGNVDHEALYKSMDFYRGKVSAGDIPPKEAAAYKFDMPDYAKGDNEPHFAALSESFREVAHKHGLTNAQANAILSDGMAAMGGVLGEYQTASAITPEKAMAALTERHGDKVPQILDKAKQAWHKVGEGLSIDSVGNSPEVIEVLARVAEFIGEDSPADGVPPVSDIRDVMNSEEYRNPRHPMHEVTMRRVNEYYAKGGRSVFK
jgi:hypothetical protein